MTMLRWQVGVADEDVREILRKHLLPDDGCVLGPDG